ncbi:mucin-associated surface protein [Trypanosoma cruzi cruzi]|uniref:Mucin-associated surface protein (MASP) n=1 Tax=Trypanosoma cruzi TaxID=5693 RepID=A0A2V2UTB2_TRYCR|nr:mucin-associated surface protein [Trypanosoma cruzi cruzi]PWU87271.1 Mucin-associated surface protein (MASP) [Trypanosoma cruzi]
MAMMMTGRVLLVCALCVLWCVAGGGGRAETPSPVSPPDEKTQNKEAVRVAGKEVQNGQPEAPQEPAPKASGLPAGVPTSSQAPQPEGGGSVAGQAAAAPTPGESDTEGKERGSNVSDPAVGIKEVAGDEEQRDANAADSQQQRGDKSSSSSSSSGSSGTEGVKQPVVKENSESNEALDDPPQEEKDLRGESDSREGEAEELEKKEEDSGNRNDKALTDISENPAKHTEVQTTTTELNGQSSAEALEDVKQSEEVQSEKDSNNNSQTKNVATIAVNQQNEPSADHGESWPPSPTENGSAANNEADKSIEEGIPNSDPAADAAETAEGKQNENKEVNPKETTVEATAMKNTTATTGDSDGSTAVSHTTSPLLLLLVVVCAAAAAVVAA